MLNEYALTPDIFCSGSFSADELGDVYLRHLKEPLLNEALVRDLREGRWKEYVKNLEPGLHPRGKELLRKLIKQNRLRSFPEVLHEEPEGHSHWCDEAIVSSESETLTGIIASKDLAEKYQEYELVGCIENLEKTPWWQKRSPSIRLDRKIEDYVQILRPVLMQANSLMFIDRNLDPEKHSYERFLDLVAPIGERIIKPFIEIHRVVYEGSGASREIFSIEHWEDRFTDAWDILLKELGMLVDIFIWDDFHDRYLITDIIGINLPNGFDVSRKPKDITTWTRLGRKERDDIQREFDVSSGKHRLQGSFKIGIE